MLAHQEDSINLKKESEDSTLNFGSFTHSLASYLNNWNSHSSHGTSQTDANRSATFMSNVSRLNASEREMLQTKAKEEATAVLSTHEYLRDRYLDHFNLLGVVTSPRLFDSSSVHGTNTSSSISNTTSTNTSNITNTNSTLQQPSVASSSTTAIFDTVNAMSESISKEIESLNSTLYAYSKAYLGEGFTLAGDYDLETYLSHDTTTTAATTTATTTGIPTSSSFLHSLEALDLSNLQEYLTKCGSLVQVFDHHQQQDVASTSYENTRSTKSAHDSITTQTVPEIFFSPTFDLTDPTTFESLLLLQNNHKDENENVSSSSNERLSESHIQKTTTLSNYLDMIELELLQQVRSKSESFFRETNRFTYLKTLVADSVQEVMELRQELDHMRKHLVSTTELVPIMDRQRNDSIMLGVILGKIVDLVEIKASVGTKIAERDYLDAVQSIQVGRSLLQGELLLLYL